jgi:hypothetical protein
MNGMEGGGRQGDSLFGIHSQYGGELESKSGRFLRFQGMCEVGI